MNHIIHYPDPMNPFPSHKPTLRHAAYEVFGKFWYLYLLALLAIVFLPSLVFWLLGEIEFHPAEFVTEWLKLSIEGVLLFFILEIVRHRSLSASARGLLLNYLAVTYILPLQEVIDSLRAFRASLESGDRDGAARGINSARKNWQMMENALSDAFLSRLPGESEAVSGLLRSRNTLDPERCNNIMRSVTSAPDSARLKPAEFDELLGRLETFLGTIKGL